ncbi:hypothetical protein F443_22493 [Phytophthora nicotianae P1569]|uniref:Uncharacterized protein n=1 Tax=Phytophthora nicotianae P1569 TaxID=1317065 RepID=V9DUU7_PHYNI|nr:hypothetical protein F443_22493 [Phytophthora nicotianae P1569]
MSTLSGCPRPSRVVGACVGLSVQEETGVDGDAFHARFLGVVFAGDLAGALAGGLAGEFAGDLDVDLGGAIAVDSEGDLAGAFEFALAGGFSASDLVGALAGGFAVGEFAGDGVGVSARVGSGVGRLAGGASSYKTVVVLVNEWNAYSKRTRTFNWQVLPNFVCAIKIVN